MVEGELAKQRAHLQQLFETIPEAIALVDLKDVVVRVNPEFTKIFGYSQDEAGGRPLNDLIAPGDLRAEADEFTKQVAGRGETLNVETIRGRKDGSHLPVSLVSVPISAGAGQIGEYAIYRDITERKRAEEALRRSETYLAEAQKLSRTGSFGWDVSSGEIYWSEETFRIFGCEPATKATIELVMRLTHPEDRSFVQQLVARVSREKTSFDFEHRLLLPGDAVKYVRVIGRPSENDSGSFEFIGAVTDITERKRSELLLKETEQRFRAIFDKAGTGIALVDLASAAPIENNVALQKMLGCTADELSRLETYEELTSEEDRESDATLFREVCDGTRETLRQEKHLVLKDGRSVWANVVFTLLRDVEGRPKRVIAIHEDITELKRAENDLRSAVDQIKKLRDQLYQENIALREEIDRSSMFEEIVGESPALQVVLAHVMKVAPTESTVLITGETGTGKELVARAIHKRSQRSTQAFISVNCAAIPPSLIASELFGHEKGAFTGAVQRRLGRFELAEGAPFSSTKLASFRWKLKSPCCVCCRSANLSGSAALRPSGPTCASLPPLIAICREQLTPQPFAATCFTGLTSFLSTCRRSEKEKKTFRSWSSISSSATPLRLGKKYEALSGRRSTGLKRIPGPATFANCRTSWNDLSLSARQKTSPWMSAGSRRHPREQTIQAQGGWESCRLFRRSRPSRRRCRRLGAGCPDRWVPRLN